MNYPNKWEGLARGIQAGTNLYKDYENILGARQDRGFREKEFGMRQKADERTAADWEYQNQKITTAGAALSSLVPGLDKVGQEEAFKILGPMAGITDPEQQLSRKEMTNAMQAFEKNPLVVERIGSLKLDSLKRQIQGMDQADPRYQTMSQEIARTEYGLNKWKQDQRKTEAEIQLKESQAKDKGEFKDIYQLIANDKDLSRDEKIKLHKQLKAKEAGADPVARAAAIEAIKEQYRIAKEEREGQTNAKTKQEEKEATATEKAGGLDKVNADTVRSWNRTRERLGMPPYKVEDVKGTLWGTNTKISQPEDAPVRSAKAPAKVPAGAKPTGEKTKTGQAVYLYKGKKVVFD